MKEKMFFFFRKLIFWIRVHVEFDKSKKKELKSDFKYLYEDSYSISNDNGLKENHYCVPEFLIISDIISKEKLTEVIGGIKALYRGYYSHKFLGSIVTEEELENFAEEMDFSISDGAGGRRIGRFDVERMRKLNREIDYFEIAIRSFSASLFCIEFKLFFTAEKQKKCANFVGKNFKSDIKRAIPVYKRNNKVSGAKIGYAIGDYSDEQEKSELVFDMIEGCKHRFLKLMMKFFPLMLFGNGYRSTGLCVWKTNIHYTEKYHEFWTSVGINAREGVFATESLKIFPKIEFSRGNIKRWSNITLIYNEETLENQYLELYNGNKRLFVEEWVFHRLSKIYKAIVIDNVTEYYGRMCASYRNKINEIGKKKRNYAQLLKLKYNFDNDYFLMEQIKKEVNTEKIINETERFFEEECDIELDRMKSYRRMCFFPVRRFNQYVDNKGVLETRLNNKILLSGDLRHYYAEKKNWLVSVVALLLSLGTFILLIFPEGADKIAEFIMLIFNLIREGKR